MSTKQLNDLVNLKGQKRYHSEPSLDAGQMENENNLKTHFQDLLLKNQKYMSHLKGDCVCGRCTCGRCKCQKTSLRPDFKKSNITSYQKEYVEHDNQINQNSEQCGKIYEQSYVSDLKMKIESTNRAEYPIHSPDNFVQKRMNIHEKKYLPFNSISSNQVISIQLIIKQMQYFFQNKNNQKALIVKPHHHATVIQDLPFNQQSNYQIEYQKHKTDNNKIDTNFVKSSFFKSPINSELPHFAVTTNNHYYKVYKTKKLKRKEKSEEYESLPNFLGQFETTMKKDYKIGNQTICPNKISLNQKKNSLLQVFSQ